MSQSPTYFVVLALAAALSTAKAQNVGIGTTTPDNSALLDLTSANRGVLIPRIAGHNGITSPANGLLVFDPSNNSFYYNAGNATAPNWLPFLSSNSGWSLTGNSSTSPATNFLGTVDAQSLVLRTNSTERARISATGSIGIGTSTPRTTLDINGDLATRYATVTLTGAAPYTVASGTSSFVRLTGPIANFSISGISGGYDGKVLVVYNSTNYYLTVLNNYNAASPNKIYTLANVGNGDVTIRGKGAVHLIYSAADSAWISIANPTSSIGTSPVSIRRKPSTDSSTSTTLTYDPDFDLPLGANEVWIIEGYFDVYGSGDFQMKFVGGTVSSILLGFHASNNGGTTDKMFNVTVDQMNTPLAAKVNTSSLHNPVAFYGVVVNGATAGNLSIYWGCNNSASKTYMSANSFLRGTLTQ